MSNNYSGFLEFFGRIFNENEEKSSKNLRKNENFSFLPFPVYKNEEELKKLLKFYLENDKEREKLVREMRKILLEFQENYPQDVLFGNMMGKFFNFDLMPR